MAFACETIESVDDLLPAHLCACRPIPLAAAFLAARSLADPRSLGGLKRRRSRVRIERGIEKPQAVLKSLQNVLALLQPVGAVVHSGTGP